MRLSISENVESPDAGLSPRQARSYIYAQVPDSQAAGFVGLERNRDPSGFGCDARYEDGRKQVPYNHSSSESRFIMW